MQAYKGRGIPGYRDTEFGGWVQDFGIKKLAKELDITPSAVYHWLRGTVVPRPDKAQEMVALSKKRLTLEQVYQHKPAVLKKFP